MKNTNKGFITGESLAFITIGLMSLFAILSIIISITGLHIQTGNGSHTGYVTATERNGFLFKTNRAYLKTDNQSSQEDTYCVMNDDVFKTLQDLQKSKKNISIEFIEYVSQGVFSCNGESAVITSVEEVK